MRYVFIGAHPDDVEFSCGGTILRLIDEGHDVYIVLMTGGEASLNGSEKERKAEQLEAAHFAKVKDIIILRYSDGYIASTSESVREMSEILDDIKPNFVFVHHPNDSHQDHRNTAQIVKSATRRKYSLVYYDSYSSIGFVPNFYVSVDEYIYGKVELLKCFESQISKYEKRGVDFVRKSTMINELNGYESNCQFAEGFAIDTYII